MPWCDATVRLETSGGRTAAPPAAVLCACPQTVQCKVKNKDQYQRSVAVCTIVGGDEINRWLVQQGLAVAYK